MRCANVNAIRGCHLFRPFFVLFRPLDPLAIGCDDSAPIPIEQFPFLRGRCANWSLDGVAAAANALGYVNLKIALERILISPRGCHRSNGVDPCVTD